MATTTKISARGINFTGYKSVASRSATIWAKEHKEQRKVIQKTYYERNKEALKAKRRARYLRKKSEAK